MIELTTKNTIIGVLITIILGAVGSGLWDIAIKPLLRIISRGLLSIITLGLERLRNPIYIRISKGKEDLSVFFYITVSLAIFATLFLFAKDVFSDLEKTINTDSIEIVKKFDRISKYEAENNDSSSSFILNQLLGFDEFVTKDTLNYQTIIECFNELKNTMQNYPNNTVFNEMTIEDQKLILELRNTVVSNTENRVKLFETVVKRWLILISILFLCPFVIVLFSLISSSYVNEAVLYFEQITCICKPYMHQGEYDVLKSEFALIKSREDYSNLLAKIYPIAKDNSIELKKFILL